MPNWCSNHIFTSNQDVIELFKKLQKRQKESGNGETMDWFNDERYLFDIEFNGDSVTFETKWSPPLKTAEAISKLFNTEIVLDYDEPGMCAFGKYIVSPNSELHYFLTMDDFNKYDYDEDKDCYIYEGEEYESDYEIKEILLEKLIDND